MEQLAIQMVLMAAAAHNMGKFLSIPFTLSHSLYSSGLTRSTDTAAQHQLIAAKVAKMAARMVRLLMANHQLPLPPSP